MNEYGGSGKERRAQIIKTIEAETGIDEVLIEQLVRDFYLRVREDALLGPIFDARISEWEPHLQRMCAFWSSVTLMSGRYHGQPMRAHLPLPIDARYFDRWLALFEATARAVCSPEAADFFIVRAHRIARSLELGVAAARGIMLGKGDRLMSEVDGSPEGTRDLMDDRGMKQHFKNNDIEVRTRARVRGRAES